jgi:hypothetical protein
MDVERLASALPDEPRWLEVRAMLRSPGASVLGLTEGGETGGFPLNFVVRVLEAARCAMAIVGAPPCVAIERATRDLNPMTPVIAQADNADHVERCLARLAPGDGSPKAEWVRERAVIHRLGAAVRRAGVGAEVGVRLLRAGDSLSHLPAGLRHEMTCARQFAPVAAVFVDDVPASFCYPVWTTESLWDVSIDTLEEYRGRSLAGAAVRFMVDFMARDGRAPVWGALESNAASIRLAMKLGFTPVDEVAVFSRGPWAFLTGGFDFDGHDHGAQNASG